MGAFAAAAGLIATVTTIAAAAAQAYATYQAGQAQAAGLRFQAEQAENQAIAARQAAAVREQQSRERLDRVRAIARARASASGIISSEGSPLLILLENARQAEFEAQLIRYGGEVQAQAAGQEAQLRLFGSRSAQRAGMIGAGTSLLSGVASAASIYARSGSTPATSSGVGGGASGTRGVDVYAP